MIKLIVSKETLIREVASNTNSNIVTIRKFHKALEEVVAKYLSQTTANEKITVKLLEGVSLECQHYKAKVVEHPQTHEKLNVPEKIWAKAKVTRNYNRKLNERGNMEQKEKICINE